MILKKTVNAVVDDEHKAGDKVLDIAEKNIKIKI
jgi:hypothetical protein